MMGENNAPRASLGLRKFTWGAVAGWTLLILGLGAWIGFRQDARFHGLTKVEVEVARASSQDHMFALWIVWSVGLGGMLLSSRSLGRQLEVRTRIADHLVEQRKRLASVVAATSAGIWEWDALSGALQLDERSTQMLGYALADLQPVDHLTVIDRVHPEDLEPMREAVREHFRGERDAFDAEFRMRHAEGHWVWVHALGRLISRTEDGQPHGMSGTYQEVSERRRLAAELEASQALLDALFKQAPIAMAYAMADGEMRFNAACEELLFGLDADAPARAESVHSDYRSWRTFLPDGTELSESERPLLLALGGKRVQDLELRVLPRDGEERWITLNAGPIRGRSGEVIAAFESMQDTTVRRSLTTKLAESQDLLEALFEQAPIAIACAMADGSLVINSACAEQFQMGDPDLPGRRTGTNLHTAERTWEVLDADRNPIARDQLPLARALRGEATRGMEGIVRRQDGTEIWQAANAAPIFGEDGQLIAAFEAFLDITDQKRATEDKLQLERQMLHAQKLESLGVLAGGIAHDFNNLLMVILGNADLALDELDPQSPVRSKLEEIERTSKRAAALAKQMLAYSGRGRFIVEPLDVGELVEEMVHLLKVSISKKAVLGLELEPGLPAIEGDVTQIRQVLMNLITNASEALGEEGGVISLSTGVTTCARDELDAAVGSPSPALDEPLPEGRYVFVEVVDTGCGMDVETMQRIFDPFFSTKFTGRGLGMSAVLGILRGHRGTLTVNSEPGGGSCFRVLLPVAGEHHLEPQHAGSSGGATTRAVVREGRGSVLVVDDESSVRAVAGRMLERLGFSPIFAGDGLEALDLLEGSARDVVVVLLDLTMPRMDGAETFRALRARGSQLPVVLCSGYDQQDVAAEIEALGPSGFLQKPFGLDSLAATLESVLGQGAES
ncbi:MAG: PAS domain S-box protein [Planctomycetota bacterium]|nr:PAS domain S-box protein [Planctomycetota bacterium]